MFIYDSKYFTYLYLLFNSIDVIKSAVAAVVRDGSFRLSSAPVTTTTALNTAIRVMEWMGETDKQEVNIFADDMFAWLLTKYPQKGWEM